MTTIYFKDADGQKISVEVTEEVAAAYAETRRAEWRNEAKERYYRDPKLSGLNDHDEELTAEGADPAERIELAEGQADKRARIAAALETLTPQQIKLVKQLKKGRTVGEIAKLWGKHHTTVSEMKKAVQKKFQSFLK